MAIIRLISLIIIILSIISCSSIEDNSRLSDVFEMYKSQNKEKKVIPITKEMIEKINYPLIEIQTNGILIQTLMLPLSTRNGIVNYTSGSGQLITLHGSLITKTNGMDVNLISLQIDPTNPLIQKEKIINWSKEKFLKTYQYLTPTYSIETLKFECKFENFVKDKIFVLEEIVLTKVTEKCVNNEISFKNFYWVNKEGIVISSSQWLNKFNIVANIKILK